MRIKALRNVRIFHEDNYFNIKKDEELSYGDYKLRELKTLSHSPAFEKIKEQKKKAKDAI